MYCPIVCDDSHIKGCVTLLQDFALSLVDFFMYEQLFDMVFKLKGYGFVKKTSFLEQNFILNLKSKKENVIYVLHNNISTFETIKS